MQTGSREHPSAWFRASLRNPSLSATLNFGGDAGAEVQFAGGPLVTPIAAGLTIAGPPPPPLRIVPSAPLKSMIINRNTGLITGKFLNGKKTVSFVGVVSQAANSGVGQFIIGGTTGQFELQP